MIDPIKCTNHLIENDPGVLAEYLLDLMVWANRPNLRGEASYDEILDLLYIKLDRAQRARDAYVKRRGR